jgi:hypothetical protein
VLSLSTLWKGLVWVGSDSMKQFFVVGGLGGGLFFDEGVLSFFLALGLVSGLVHVRIRLEKTWFDLNRLVSA